MASALTDAQYDLFRRLFDDAAAYVEVWPGEKRAYLCDGAVSEPVSFGDVMHLQHTWLLVPSEEGADGRVILQLRQRSVR